MARNRQKAKQRKAKQQANAEKGGGQQPTPAAGEAPPVDEGTVKAAASVEAAEEIRRTAKLKPEPAKSQPAKAQQSKSKAAAKAPKEKGRFRTFLRSSWAELRRVQWPDRQQLSLMSTIVIVFVGIVGAYLGAIDWVAQRIVDFLVF